MPHTIIFEENGLLRLDIPEEDLDNNRELESMLNQYQPGEIYNSNTGTVEFTFAINDKDTIVRLLRESGDPFYNYLHIFTISRYGDFGDALVSGKIPDNNTEIETRLLDKPFAVNDLGTESGFRLSSNEAMSLITYLKSMGYNFIDNYSLNVPRRRRGVLQEEEVVVPEVVASRRRAASTTKDVVIVERIKLDSIRDRIRILSDDINKSAEMLAALRNELGTLLEGL